MTHVPLVTVGLDDEGAHATVTITCNACAGGTFTLATPHLATLAHTLVGVCAILHIDISRPGYVLTFDSPEDRRAAEAKYAMYIRQRREEETQP